MIVMKWLSENYKWLFDGVAGAAVIAVIGYVIHHFLNTQNRQGTVGLTAQGAKVTNSPVASGSGITQTINSPTINLSARPATREQGCDLWLEFSSQGSRFLLIQNGGAEPAFDVVLYIPADGSGFKSDVINRLDSDRNWVTCASKGDFVRLESIRQVLAQAVLDASSPDEVKAIPVLIRYRTREQQDCEFHLEIRMPLKNGIQFALPGNQRSNTRLAWPEQKGEYIAVSSEAIPHFPETLSGYRSEDEKDFWKKPFPVKGSIRLFEGDDWRGIPEFPHTMNACSAGVFMIRWRSADPNVRVRSSVRHSSKSKADEKTGIFGYMSGTSCDQPMFRFADSRNGNTLVDLYYELKFWQAAP
jgi:hypothetical protein